MKEFCSIDIESSGKINGVHYVARGAGSADPDLGLIEFRMQFEPTPPRVDPFGSLLSVLIIPSSNFGRQIDGARNLSRLTGGTFQFTQDVSDRGVAVKSTGKVSRTGDLSYRWSSNAEGFVDIEHVSAVEPFDAVMVPYGAGKIVESVSIPVIAGGRRRRIAIVRQFTFSPELELPGVQLRRMILEPSIGTDWVSVKIQADIMPFNLVHSYGRN